MFAHTQRAIHAIEAKKQATSKNKLPNKNSVSDEKDISQLSKLGIDTKLISNEAYKNINLLLTTYREFAEEYLNTLKEKNLLTIEKINNTLFNDEKISLIGMLTLLLSKFCPNILKLSFLETVQDYDTESILKLLSVIIKLQRFKIILDENQLQKLLIDNKIPISILNDAVKGLVMENLCTQTVFNKLLTLRSPANLHILLEEIIIKTSGSNLTEAELDKMILPLEKTKPKLYERAEELFDLDLKPSPSNFIVAAAIIKLNKLDLLGLAASKLNLKNPFLVDLCHYILIAPDTALIQDINFLKLLNDTKISNPETTFLEITTNIGTNKNNLQPRIYRKNMKDLQTELSLSDAEIIELTKAMCPKKINIFQLFQQPKPVSNVKDPAAFKGLDCKLG